MAAAKKKPPIDARDIVVHDRALLGVLADLAEQIKANDARCAARADRLDEVLAETAKRSARAEEMAAEAAERSARAEEMAALALRSISSLLEDLHALTQRYDASNARFEGRLEALENAAE